MIDPDTERFIVEYARKRNRRTRPSDCIVISPLFLPKPAMSSAKSKRSVHTAPVGTKRAKAPVKEPAPKLYDEEDDDTPSKKTKGDMEDSVASATQLDTDEVELSAASTGADEDDEVPSTPPPKRARESAAPVPTAPPTPTEHDDTAAMDEAFAAAATDGEDASTETGAGGAAAPAASPPPADVDTPLAEKEIKRFSSPEAALERWCGKDGLNHVYFTCVKPADHFKIYIKDVSDEDYKRKVSEFNRICEEKKSNGKWTKEDDEEYKITIDRSKSNLSRYITYTTGKPSKLYQLGSGQEDGDGSRYVSKFLYRSLPYIVDACVLSPFCRLMFPRLSLKGNFGAGQYGGKTLEDSSYEVCICDKPIDYAGYTDENKRNPHAVKFFDYCRDELAKNGLVREMLRNSNLLKAKKEKVLGEITKNLEKELTTKKLAANAQQARAMMSSDPETKKRLDDMIESKLLETFHPLVQTGKEDDITKNYVEYLSCKRRIFRKTFKSELEKVQRRLREGYYDKKVPPEYLDVMKRQNGEVIYEPLLVMRLKTTAEIKETWETDPQPFIDLTWEERARLGPSSVAAVLFELEITEQTQTWWGFKSSKPVAIIVASFNGDSATYKELRARREEEFKQQPCVIEW